MRVSQRLLGPVRLACEEIEYLKFGIAALAVAIGLRWSELHHRI
jgi:hypothetical protein